MVNNLTVDLNYIFRNKSKIVSIGKEVCLKWVEAFVNYVKSVKTGEN